MPNKKTNGNQSNQAEDRLVIKEQISNDASHLLIRLEGRLDIFTYKELASHLSALFVDWDLPWLVIDLSKVSFVASSGWSVFLVAAKKLRKKEAKLAVVGMSTDVRRVFDAMKMGKVSVTFKKIAEAEEYISKAIKKERKTPREG